LSIKQDLQTRPREYYATIAATRSRIATLSAQENRLDATIAHESRKAEALHTPERLIAMIEAGDAAMRLSLRTEIRRVISQIELDFAVEPDIEVTLRFVNDATRKVTFRKPRPLRGSRLARSKAEPAAC
jgi:hypothetical protein